MQRRAATAGLVAVGVLGCGHALALPCHPDRPGTRTLVVHGQVTGYVMHGTRVELGYTDTRGCARRVAWNLATAATRRAVGGAAGGCRTFARLGDSVRVPDVVRAVAAFQGRRHAIVGARTVTLFDGTRRVATLRRSTRRPALKAVLRGSRLIVLARGSEVSDTPDRLEVYDTAAFRSLGSWPLVGPAATLDLSGDIALFSAERREGIYALRLSDGATRFVGPAWVGDTPQIEPAGVVYEDSTFDRDRLAHHVPVKFVPSGAIAFDFAHTFRTLRTDGPVTGLSMDGANLAVTFRGPNRECDQVRIWQVYWQDVAKPTMDSGAGCSAHDLIQGVAETGIIARWIVRIGRVQRLVWSSSKNCVQHFVAQTSSGDRLLAVAGSGGLAAYAIGRADGSTTLVTSSVDSEWKSVRTQVEQAPRAMVSDGERLAVLDARGKVSVILSAGDVSASIDVGNARAIALRDNSLMTITGRQLEQYSVSDGQRVRVWNLAGRASSVSVRYGIALVTVGHDVLGLRLADGRRVRLARTAGAPLAVIDKAGVAFASAGSRRGGVTFIPMADVERAFSAR
jgi:hypothetical protein